AEQRIELPARVDVILCGTGPRNGMDRTVNQRHQQGGRNSFSGDVAQHQRRTILGHVKNITEVSTDLRGGDALCRKGDMRCNGVRRRKQIRLNSTREIELSFDLLRPKVVWKSDSKQNQGTH